MDSRLGFQSQDSAQLRGDEVGSLEPGNVVSHAFPCLIEWSYQLVGREVILRGGFREKILAFLEEASSCGKFPQLGKSVLHARFIGAGIQTFFCLLKELYKLGCNLAVGGMGMKRLLFRRRRLRLLLLPGSFFQCGDVKGQKDKDGEQETGFHSVKVGTCFTKEPRARR